MRPGMSVRPPPSMTVTFASAGGWILTRETRSMMLPRTITLLGSVSFSALPSKIRTFSKRVTASLGAAVAALAASVPAAGEDTVAVAAPVAAPPVSDPDGVPDGAQPPKSMSAITVLRNRTRSRMKASSAGSTVMALFAEAQKVHPDIRCYGVTGVNPAIGPRSDLCPRFGDPACQIAAKLGPARGDLLGHRQADLSAERGEA